MNARVHKGYMPPLPGAKATPLGESGSAVDLEILTDVEVALLIEEIVDRGVDGSEFLQCSHAPEAEHRPLPSSERLMRILGTIVHPAASLLPVANAELAKRGTVGAQTVGNEFIGVAMALQRFPQEFQGRLLVARLRHEALEHFAFVVDGTPEGMPLAVDLHENLVEMPPPAAGPHARHPAFPDFRANIDPNL